MNHEPDTKPAVFWCAVAVGGAICLYGLHGLVDALNGITSQQFVQWFVGANVAHDLIVAPLACLAGVTITRIVPAPARAQVAAGLFASAVVLAIAWAPLHGYGRDTAPDNPTVQPLDYTTAVPTVLVVVWALVAGWIVFSLLRRRRWNRERVKT